jgi:hypothetical protein
MYSSVKLILYSYTTVTEKVKRLLFLFVVLAAAQMTPQTLLAQLEIEIISGNPSALPIAIVPFQRFRRPVPFGPVRPDGRGGHERTST